MHGKTSRMELGGGGLLRDMPSPLEVKLYHSMFVERESLPPALEVLATTRDEPTEIQALRHREHPVWGVQFHPESILTQSGRQLLMNFLTLAGC
jgi:anthranilate/para-aminobenzoate synthase component II